MTDALVCAHCGHTDEQHETQLGFCEAAGCQCVCFRLEDDFEDDEDELDFDHGQDGAA